MKRDDIDMVNEYTCEAIKSTRDLYSIRSLDVMDVAFVWMAILMLVKIYPRLRNDKLKC